MYQDQINLLVAGALASPPWCPDVIICKLCMSVSDVGLSSREAKSSIVPKGQLSGSGPTCCWWISHPWSCFSVIINPSSANIGNLLSYLNSSSFTYQQDHDKYFTRRFEGGIGGELHKINCHHGVRSIFNHSILLGRNKLLKIPFWPNVQSYGE